MAAHVLMLRGVNLGKRRVPMAELRSLLGEAGFAGVRTYVQSGNVVLESDLAADAVAARAHELISQRFGFDVPVVARSRQRLARVIAADPLAEIVENPKLYQVTFLSGELDGAAAERLQGLVGDGEQLALAGQELYSWHPNGIARSKLAVALGAKWLGVMSTSRNWTTVATLLEMAGG
ncbi:MAG: DUF1697 domain-containing protein [Solirubrobacteraceae bacterium]|jgi:uncharacterized protein (DUF1697 family)